MTDAELPKWLDDIDIGTIAVLTLDDGESLTADILNLNDEGDELIVDVVSSNRPSVSSDKRSRSISVSRVVSIESRSRGATVAIF